MNFIFKEVLMEQSRNDIWSLQTVSYKKCLKELKLFQLQREDL